MRRATLCSCLIALAAACSSKWAPQEISHLNDGEFHRECAAVLPMASCSSLGIVTTRELVPSIPTGQLFARGDGIDAYDAPALIHHFVLDGIPPRFRENSTITLQPSPGANGSMATDGKSLFSCSTPYGLPIDERFRVWDSAARLTSETFMSDDIPTYGCAVAGFQGLGLAVHSGNGFNTTYVFDSNGTIGYEHAGGFYSVQAVGYGCGFATFFGGVTFMPMDGRGQSNVTVDGVGYPLWALAFPWPPDPHAVAIVSIVPSTGFGDSDASAPDGGTTMGRCSTLLALAFDDGRQYVKRSFDWACIAPAEGPFGLLNTSFGPVLNMGGGRLQLVDATANPVGDVLQVDVGTPANTQFVAIGNHIVALSTEGYPNSEFYETVVGCLNPSTGGR